MASSTVRVQGLRELQRDFRKLDKNLAKDLRGELREVGDVVKAEAASNLSRLSARSASGLKTRVRARAVAVEQSRRRTTGKRPDWGSLQMNRILVPALDEKQDEVVEKLDRVLGRLAGENGF